VNRLLLTILVIGAVIGGGVYYVLRTRAPGRNYDAARAEIERWEERANKMRTCLLGTTPASAIAAEALAIRELTNNSPEFKKCTASISELSRGDAPDTGIKDVEDEWKSLTKAITGLASAFARVLVTGGNKHAAIDDLGEALDTLDVANANLRQAAQLDPEPSGKAKPSLAKAEVIVVGTSKRAKLSAWLRPSAGGMVALVEAAGRPQQQLVLVPGQPPKRVPFKGDVRPSVTDTTWAVQAGDGQLAYGKLMADGSIDAPIAKPTGAAKAVPHILFTLGSAAGGAVAYIPDAARATPQVALARLLTDVFEAGTLFEAEDYAFAVDPPQRGLLAWSAKGELHGALVTPPSPAPPPAAGSGSAAPAPPRTLPAVRIVALGAGHTGLSCLTKTHGWMASGERFIAFDATSASSVELPGHELIGCDETSVLLREAGHRYTVCTLGLPRPIPTNPEVAPTPECRVVELTAGADAMPALSAGKVIAVATRQRVLAVWREQADATYFVMPQAFKPRLVQATEKLLDVLGETDEGLAVVRAAL